MSLTARAKGEAAMPRKDHPADIRNDEIAANAVRYELALFLGRGEFARACVETIEEVPAAASGLVTTHRNGRRPLIYAIDAFGRAALINGSMQPSQEKSMNKTYRKKFNARRAAKAAGHDLADIETFKSGNGYAWRLKPKPPEAPVAKALDETPELPRRRRARFTEMEAAARNGILPPPPDFSAPTHARFRGKLAKLIAMAEAGDAEGLKSVSINPISSSPKAMARYRDLCVMALGA
jgi:hypothetical protein